MADAKFDRNFKQTLLAVSSSDGQTPINLEANPTTGALLTEGSTGGLISEAYDYISASYPDGVTEVYTYKLGGSAGTTVATLTVVYTASTKDNISSVTKT